MKQEVVVLASYPRFSDLGLISTRSQMILTHSAGVTLVLRVDVIWCQKESTWIILWGEMLIKRKELNNVSKWCMLNLSDLCTKTTISTSVMPRIINVEPSPLLYIYLSAHLSCWWKPIRCRWFSGWHLDLIGYSSQPTCLPRLVRQRGRAARADE